MTKEDKEMIKKIVNHELKIIRDVNFTFYSDSFYELMKVTNLTRKEIIDNTKDLKSDTHSLVEFYSGEARFPSKKEDEFIIKHGVSALILMKNKLALKERKL